MLISGRPKKRASAPKKRASQGPSEGQAAAPKKSGKASKGQQPSASQSTPAMPSQQASQGPSQSHAPASQQASTALHMRMTKTTANRFSPIKPTS